MQRFGCTSQQSGGMLAFMTEEVHTDTEHNRSFRTHNGYLAAFRYLAFDGRGFGALDYHLGKLADRSLSVYSNQIKPVKPPSIERLSAGAYTARGVPKLSFVLLLS
jgi:hypothetical protein